MSFITDPTSSFWTPKVNWRERPAVRTDPQWLSAENMNQVRSALLDLRSSVISIGVQSTQTAVTDQIIYVRTTGSDVTGDGTALTPYATFARAIRDVPAKCDMTRYWLDVTGITEYLPNDIIFAPRFGMPMNPMQDGSGWENITFSGSASFLYSPPVEFPWVTHAENINVVAAPAPYREIASGTVTITEVDVYSGLNQVLFQSVNDFTDNQYDQMFLHNINHPRQFTPIWRTVSPNILYVASSDGQLPSDTTGWQIVVPGATVLFVPISSTADRPTAGMWLGGGSAGIHIFGLNWTKHPALNLKAKWVLGTQGATFIENFCRTVDISGTSWGANVVTPGARFQSFQCVMNGQHMLGGGNSVISNCVNVNGDVHVISGSYSSIETLPVNIGVSNVAFVNSEIASIGGVAGNYKFEHIRVDNQTAMDIGLLGETSSSRGANITLHGFAFYNASGSADLGIYNSKNVVMNKGWIAGSLTLDEETQLLVRDSAIDGKLVASDNCWMEFYNTIINGRGGSPGTAPEISIGRGCYASLLTCDFATNTSVYINDRAKVYMRRCSGTWDVSSAPWSGSQFVVNRRAELALSAPNFITATLGSDRAFFMVGHITASMGEMFSSGSIKDESPGYGEPRLTWW